MRAIVLLLLVILIFLGCAFLGYELAGIQKSSGVNEKIEVVTALKSEQHNLILIRVDQLDAERPQLISVWFVSFFFASNQPSSITLGQVYPLSEGKSIARALERAFSLDDTGAPSAGFLNVLSDNNFVYEAYILIDTAGANEALGWLLGPGDYWTTLEAAAVNQAENKRLTNKICEAVADAQGQDIGLFNWSGLVPRHFRSNLRIENGLAYWARITDPDSAIRCEIILTP